MAAAAGLAVGRGVAGHRTQSGGKEALLPAPPATGCESHALSEHISSSVKGMTESPDVVTTVPVTSLPRPVMPPPQPTWAKRQQGSQPSQRVTQGHSAQPLLPPTCPPLGACEGASA